MDVKSLIEEVLIDLGNNKTLIDVSSKIQIIVRLLGDEKLKEWYKCEFITGYKDQELPEYRVSQAADIKADYIVPYGLGSYMKYSNQSVPVSNLGIDKYDDIIKVRIKDTISAIVEYSKHPDNIVMSLTPYEYHLVQKTLGEAQIQNVHKIISPSTFQTIIDNVKGRIIEMFMDLDEKVFNGKLDIKTEEFKREIHQVITNNITAGIIQTGDGLVQTDNSTIASIIQSDLSVDAINQLSSILDQIEDIANNNKLLDELEQDIKDIRSELSSSNPDKGFLKKSFKALIWGASVSCKTAIEELVKKALDSINIG